MAADASDSKVENVRVVFDNGVRLFYVGKDNVVTAPTESTFLRAVISDASDDLDVPLAWLQVGDWKYPLNMNKKPIHKYNSRIYVFPDLREVENAAYVGVQLPTLSSARVLKALLEFLHTFSGLKVFPDASTDLAEALTVAGMLPSWSAETSVTTTEEPEKISAGTTEVTDIPPAFDYDSVSIVAPPPSAEETNKISAEKTEVSQPSPPVDDKPIVTIMAPPLSAETNTSPAEGAVTAEETTEVDAIPPAVDYQPVIPVSVAPVSDSENNEARSGLIHGLQISIPTMPELPGGMPLSTMIAASFMAGAERIGHSLVHSADVVSELIKEGTLLIMDQISPPEEEVQVPVEVLLSVDAVEQATEKAVEFSDFLVVLVRNGTANVGSWAMPYLRSGSHKIFATLTSGNSDDAGQNMDQLLQVAGGCAVGLGTVFTGLDYAARNLGNSIATSSAQIVKKKYGRAAGSVVGSTTRSLGNTLTVKNTLTAVIPRVAAQAAANSSVESYMHEVPPQQGSAAGPRTL